MQKYLPEAVQAGSGGLTAELLRAACEENLVLQAPAAVCTEDGDLLVDLGFATGRIPKEETAIGIRDGTVKPIAVLSRVGKPVSFRVTGMENGQYTLSRRMAQEDARRYLFRTKTPGDIIRAVITSLAPFGAFCDVGCGLTALMGIETISVSRISHSRDRFREDQPVYAVIKDLDRELGRISLSHRELLGTWEENAARFRAGQTVVGIVRSVQSYGAFVELAPNLSGLAEPNDDLRQGDLVSVYIKAIVPERLKIKLVALRRLEPGSLPAKPLPYFITEGHLDIWRYGTEDDPKAVTVF